MLDISDFFDDAYSRHARYWWKQDGRYATDPGAYPYSLLSQMTLRLLAGRPPGEALDLGAGEGTDSIRLALLGYHVTAVEISEVAAEKIAAFASGEGVKVNVEVADVRNYQPAGPFDVVICNGVLHYVEDKEPVVRRMQDGTRPGGINVVSLWSTRTPVPACHSIVPVFCDDEEGVVSRMYSGWREEIRYFERGKPESSHGGMPSHAHSHIKLIARRPVPPG